MAGCWHRLARSGLLAGGVALGLGVLAFNCWLVLLSRSGWLAGLLDTLAMFTTSILLICDAEL